MAVASPIALGASIPAHLPHAISVSLPTWRDNVGYEEGEPRVVNAMVTGYPRFFIHKSVQKLQALCETRFGQPNERCLLFPTVEIATACQNFLLRHCPNPADPSSIRTIGFSLSPSGIAASTTGNATLDDPSSVKLHIVLFPSDLFPLAKSFWQHTGDGISSRLAERCLAIIASLEKASSPPISPRMEPTPSSPTSSSSRNRHYSSRARGASLHTRSLSHPPATNPELSEESFSTDQAVYLEERYGRNLPERSAEFAKRTLKRRIAGVLVNDIGTSEAPSDIVEEVGPSKRGLQVTEDDVYLFPAGMSAIWHAHDLALSTLPPAKSVCFGFPYTDTLKILQKWGPGCHFFGHGLDSDIDSLASLLSNAVAEGDPRPILALFCEFPSNPLLRAPNLQRLRSLADQYDFLIVVDETIGSFANVEVLPFADIVVSSLSKVFSGEVNVMGGSLVLNPQSRHYTALKAHAPQNDWYWGEDAVFMERNSRDFAHRVKVINDNTEALCDMLHARSTIVHQSNGDTEQHGRPVIIKDVFYPKFVTKGNYDACRLPHGGYGGLFSVVMTSTLASQVFFDALPCAKGPSLGTNFTLACPYTILAHYGELDWAQGYGVEEGLIRVSVGLEDREALLKSFDSALRLAEEAVMASR